MSSAHRNSVALIAFVGFASFVSSCATKNSESVSEATVAAEHLAQKIGTEFDCSVSINPETSLLFEATPYTFWVVPRGSECDQALVELNRRGAAHQIQFNEIQTLSPTEGAQPPPQGSNQDLIHEVDPQDAT